MCTTKNSVTTEFASGETTASVRILGEVRSDGGERLYAHGPEGFAVQRAVGGAVEYPLLDGLVTVVTTGASYVPIAGEFAGGTQLLWDLLDPFHPW